jgi:hypothetical protein
VIKPTGFISKKRETDGFSTTVSFGGSSGGGEGSLSFLFFLMHSNVGLVKTMSVYIKSNGFIMENGPTKKEKQIVIWKLGKVTNTVDGNVIGNRKWTSTCNNSQQQIIKKTYCGIWKCLRVSKQDNLEQPQQQYHLFLTKGVQILLSVKS